MHDVKNSFKWGLCENVIGHTILGGSPVIPWISLGGKPKWLPLKFGYHDVMRKSPILKTNSLYCIKGALFPPTSMSAISAGQTREQTHGKIITLYHMPGWLTLTKQLQTPSYARVPQNTCKQVMSFAQRLNSMTTPVKSDEQFGSQTCMQIKSEG